MSSGPLISLVVPMLDEEDNVNLLMDRMTAIAADNPNFAFELIAIDDGSSDGTVAALSHSSDLTVPLVLVSLSRNFGSHYAISAGLRHAKGDAAIVLGADLQEPPDLVGRFLESWQQGAQVVWGIRQRRVERGMAGLTSRAFSRLFHRYSDLKAYPAEGPSGVLVDRQVMDVVNELKERHRNVLGLIAWTGFTQGRVQYEQQPRSSGTSKWTSRKLMKLALDSFIQFSSAPIKLAGLLGVVLSGTGFLYASVLVLLALLGSGAPEGWTTVVVVVLILGGLQLLMLALLGEYLWRVTDESRNRPVFVERFVVHRDPREETARG